MELVIALPPTCSPTFDEQLSAWRRLGKRRGQDVLGKAIVDYKHQGEALTTAMRQALDTGNQEVLGKSAHQLAGTSIMLGAGRLVELARQIEARAYDGRLVGLSALLQEMGDEFEHFVEILATETAGCR